MTLAFGPMLRDWRETRRMTQEQLAFTDKFGIPYTAAAEIYARAVAMPGTACSAGNTLSSTNALSSRTVRDDPESVQGDGQVAGGLGAGGGGLEQLPGDSEGFLVGSACCG